MSSSNSSCNRINVPKAKQGRSKFKMLTRQRGRRESEERRGRRPRQDQMVKKIWSTRNVVCAGNRRGVLAYIVSVTV